MTRINKKIKIGNTDTKLGDLIGSPKLVYSNYTNSKMSYTFDNTGLYVIAIGRINGTSNAGLYIVNHYNGGTTYLTTVANVSHGSVELTGATFNYTMSAWSRMVIFQIG